MKKSLTVLFLTLFILSFSSAQVQVDYYFGLTCPHCQVVEDSGILEKVASSEVSVNKYEVWYNSQNQEKFNSILNGFSTSVNERGVPFLVVNCSGKMTYLVGDQPIINNLESYVSTCSFPEKVFDSSKAVSGNKSYNGLILVWTLVILIIAFFGWLAFRKK